MKKKRIHRTILALLLIFVPPFFLVFTEEGNRVSDNVMLWAFGHESMRLNLKEADHSFTEESVRKVYPDIDWQCGVLQSDFGDEACNAVIGTFNELPASRITLFFAHKQLNAIKLDYRRRYHERMVGHVIETLGQPVNVESATSGTPDADPVLQWQTGKGIVVLKKTIAESDQPALLWLGSAQ